MEKLLALLNQFEKYKKSWFTWRSIDSYDNCVYWVDCDWETEITMYSDLYSKYYGFIKWLVDNDKIDFDKIQIWFQLTLWYWKYDSLLMLLSISDTPIADLVSYLK
jgi:hypothetical protein